MSGHVHLCAGCGLPVPGSPCDPMWDGECAVICDGCWRAYDAHVAWEAEQPPEYWIAQIRPDTPDVLARHRWRHADEAWARWSS